ncbi:serine protease 30-like isoform X2 [Stegodyphus dumicola]|uniref:serine protease 30-like isoform X2 n=1 Tax=Stegodyphus dumicola TaxID=202533 RepID=UPI0015A9EA40|nr:serine protease 30-like isoform X2 [Stegodyphus dumicola]
MKSKAVIIIIFFIISAKQVIGEHAFEKSCYGKHYLTVQEGQSVNISSPEFEDNYYPKNCLCSWTIRANNDTKRLYVDFVDLSIWPTFNCILDGLVLFDGDSNSAPILGLYCTGTPSVGVKTTGRFIHVVFYSSEFPQHRFRGFMLNITEVDQESFPINLNIHCGITPISPELGNGDRIVGGRPAVPGSWPWQCSLRRKGNTIYGHLCGAVLINNQWLLTVAHCFRDFPNASLWTAHFGKFYKEKKETTEQIRYLKEIFIHPDYNGMRTNSEILTKKGSDIALVRINAPVAMTDYVRPVCLPPWKAQILPGTLCHVTGWGSTMGTGNSDVLKQAEVPVVSHETCARYYTFLNISKTMICAGYASGGHDSCQGDSGGPLVLQKLNHWYLVGLVSTGGNCAAAKQPGIYTNVSSFKAWILKIMYKHK